MDLVICPELFAVCRLLDFGLDLCDLGTCAGISTDRNAGETWIFIMGGSGTVPQLLIALKAYSTW
jgi:hypothetical protein